MRNFHSMVEKACVDGDTSSLDLLYKTSIDNTGTFPYRCSIDEFILAFRKEHENVAVWMFDHNLILHLDTDKVVETLCHYENIELLDRLYEMRDTVDFELPYDVLKAVNPQGKNYVLEWLDRRDLLKKLNKREIDDLVVKACCTNDIGLLNWIDERNIRA